MVLHRIALPFINALFITTALFAFMYSLIDIGEAELRKPFKISKINYVHVPKDENVIITVPKVSEPEFIDAAPDFIRYEPDSNIELDGDIGWAEFEPIKTKGGDFEIANRQLVIALGFPPEYPRTAISRNIEGYAIVGFSVNKAGSVFNPYIIESEPGSVFDRSALKGIMKFKYKARMVDGHPVVTDGQRYQFTYKLDK